MKVLMSGCDSQGRWHLWWLSFKMIFLIKAMCKSLVGAWCCSRLFFISPTLRRCYDLIPRSQGFTCFRCSSAPVVDTDQLCISGFITTDLTSFFLWQQAAMCVDACQTTSTPQCAHTHFRQKAAITMFMSPSIIHIYKSHNIYVIIISFFSTRHLVGCSHMNHSN